MRVGVIGGARGGGQGGGGHIRKGEGGREG